jgi:hypothetical protein
VVFHLPLLQHCKSEGVVSQHMKLWICGKRGAGYRKAQRHSQAGVKPNAFVQSGHGIPPMSAAQASSATAQSDYEEVIEFALSNH